MRHFLLICGLAMLTGSSDAANIVVFTPAGSVTNEGNSFLFSPFDTGIYQARLQQVYSASLFSMLPPEGGWIEQIIFQTDRIGNDFFTTLSNVEVALSTTQLEPDALNRVFSANIGPDVKTVLGPGPLTLRAFGPQSWSVLLDLRSNPFYYNPGAGNLLLDIVNLGGGFTSPLDAEDVLGDTISSVYAEAPVISGTGTPRTVGLVTVFSIAPIPEPAPALLLLAASLAGLVWRLTRILGRNSRHVPH